ncbi:MAG: glycosyltransferase family 4 protein [Anaerolineales bacterium]|nr:glycosyltransferase family 4 protein [Anaerolineales bacterium]
MRVLMISKACIVGTYQRKLEEMATAPDLDLSVVVPPSWRDERGETQLERVFTQGYDLIVSPIRFNGRFHWHYYPALEQHLDHIQPDILHIDEEPYSLVTWLALRAARRRNIKTLFFSWQNILRPYPPPFRWFEQTVLQHADYALMGTESAAAVWRAKGYTGPLAVIPQFGVDPDLFCPDSTPHPPTPMHIGYAGRLWIGKAVDVLIAALANLRELDWRLTLIGSGPEQATLTAQIEQLSLQDRIQIVPWVASTAMPAYMRALDILVIPSRTRRSWKEQYGRVIIEAMASGVAVIGSNSGAIPDVIGDAGLVFAEDDVDDLTCHLRHLIADSAARHDLARRGRQRVLAHFTQAQIAEKTIEVYRSMLK